MAQHNLALKTLPPLPETRLHPEFQPVQQLTHYDNEHRESVKPTDKPLPPLADEAELLSLDDVILRQQRLQELEKLHEKQQQEFESYQRREVFYHQQAGIFPSRFDEESQYTRDQNREEPAEMLNEIILSIRGAQCVFAIILLGFTSYVAYWWRLYWHSVSPLEFNFLLFLSVQSLVSLVYIVITSSPSLFSISQATSQKLKRFHYPYVVLATDAFLLICFLGGFIALGVFLKKRICFGTVCNVARASVGFGAFLWLFFLATTIHSGIMIYQRWKSNMAARAQPIWRETPAEPASDVEEEEKKPPGYSTSPGSMV